MAKDDDHHSVCVTELTRLLCAGGELVCATLVEDNVKLHAPYWMVQAKNYANPNTNSL